MQRLCLRKRGDRLQPGTGVDIVRIVLRRNRERPGRCERDVRAQCGDGDAVFRFADRHIAEVEGNAQRRKKLPGRDRDPFLRGGDHGRKIEREQSVDERRHVDGVLRHGERFAEEAGDDLHDVADGDAHFHAVDGKIYDGRIALIGKIKRLLRAVVRNIERAAHGERSKIQRDIAAQYNIPELRRKGAGKIDADRFTRDEIRELEDHAREVGVGCGIARFGDGLLRIGQLCAHLHTRKRKLRRDVAQRDGLAVLCNFKGKVDGKLHAGDREHRGKRCTSAVLRDDERAAAELLQERIGIERTAVPLSRHCRKQCRKLHGVERPAEILADAKIDVLARIGNIKRSDLRAHFHRRKVSRVDVDEPFDRPLIERQPEAEGGRALQNRRKRRRKAARRRHRTALLRTRRGFGGILGVVILIDGRFRLFGAVFVCRVIGSAAADGDAHRGGIALVDIRGKYLPGGIEGIGDGDVLKRGKPRESARRHHLVDVVGGRLVGRRVEIIGL